MTTSESAIAKVRNALRWARELVDTVADTKADLDNMPFFVRPMVKRGYRKRTGLDLEGWTAEATALVRRLEHAPATAASDDILEKLRRLAENYRTAPERAARGMAGAPATQKLMRESAKRREGVVNQLHQALVDLGSAGDTR